MKTFQLAAVLLLLGLPVHQPLAAMEGMNVIDTLADNTKQWTGKRNAQKPNVAVFFVDDMGYNELGCYGSPDLGTPFIDSLAKHGCVALPGTPLQIKHAGD